MDLVTSKTTVTCHCESGVETLTLGRGRTLEIRLKGPVEEILEYKNDDQISCVELQVTIRRMVE